MSLRRYPRARSSGTLECMEGSITRADGTVEPWDDGAVLGDGDSFTLRYTVVVDDQGSVLPFKGYSKPYEEWVQHDIAHTKGRQYHSPILAEPPTVTGWRGDEVVFCYPEPDICPTLSEWLAPRPGTG